MVKSLLMIQNNKRELLNIYLFVDFPQVTRYKTLRTSVIPVQTSYEKSSNGYGNLEIGNPRQLYGFEIFLPIEKSI